MRNTTNLNKVDLEQEIYEKRKEVRYDTREMTLEFISEKFKENLMEESLNTEHMGLIYIPEYQRDFTWDEVRQSKLIESIVLGLPLPSLFIAETESGAWEIIDGSQRIRTIHAFLNNELKLQGLEKLTSLNGYRFADLKLSRQRKLYNTALRIIVLDEETTDEVKKDMFDRINRGSDLLKPMEKRKGSYRGRFSDFIYSYCKNNESFRELLAINKWLQKRQEREELLLRFFALSEGDKINIPGTGITSFLDKYIEKKNKEWGELDEKEWIRVQGEYETKINEVNNFVRKHFPYGYRHRQNPETKRSVFEAISLGSWRVLQSKREVSPIKPKDIEKALASEQFRKDTQIVYQLHKKEKLEGRINFIYNLFVKG
jgi:hypothetical protein